MADYQLYQSPGQHGQQGAPPPPPPARPKRKNPYNDGISSSAQYYDLFEMIRHPNAPKALRPPDPPPRSLSKQQQLELEIEKSFRKKQRQAFLAAFVKFLFLAFILPPYILLYRLPKLLFVDSIVSFTNYIDNKLMAIGRAIQSRYNQLKAKIRNAILSFWHLIKKTFKRKLARTEHPADEPVSFLAFIAEGLVGLYRYTLYPLIRGSIKGWQLLKRTAKAIRNFPSQLHQAIQISLKRYHSWRDRLIARIKTKIFQTLESIKNRTTRPISRWIDAKILALVALARRGQEALIRLVKGIAFALRHPIQTARLLRDSIRTTYQQAYRALLARLQAYREASRQAWLRFIAYLDNTFVAPVRALRARLKAKILALYTWCKSPYSNSVRFFREFIANQKRKISAYLQARLEAPKRWLKQIAAPFIAASQLIRALYAKVYARIAKRIERIKTFILTLLSPFIWAGRELKKQLKSLAQPLVRFYQGCARRLAALAWHLRRLVAWIHILYRYGMELVRGTAEKSFGLR